MILAIRHLGESRYLSQAAEVAKSIEDVFSLSESAEGDSRATWFFSRREGDQAFVSCLEVSLNLRTGYGGAVWFAGGREAKRIEEETGSDIGYYFWVSDNEAHPEVDPQIVSDPHSPSYFDYRGAFPVESVRSIVEEYCLASGDRPSVIHWVAGNQNGTRLA